MYKVLLFENDKRIDNVINTFSNEKGTIVTLKDIEVSKEELIAEYTRLREGKADMLGINEAIEDEVIKSALLLSLGKVDGVVGGCITTSSRILSASVRLLRNGFVSTASVLSKDEETLIFADTSLPTAEEHYIDMTKNTISLAQSLSIAPSVALLSHSTNGSSNLEEAKKIQEYAKELKGNNITCEIQFDAAYDLSIAKTKGLDLWTKPNVYIFPNLDAANIGYKIAQQLGGYKVAGPIVCGLRKPFNDLSRGATVEDIIETINITIKQIEGNHE